LIDTAKHDQSQSFVINKEKMTVGFALLHY